MKCEVHHLRARHLQRTLPLRQAALLEHRTDRRNAHILGPLGVLANGHVDGVKVEAEMAEHVEEPCALGAQQPVGSKVQAILRCKIRRCDMRDVNGVESKDELVEAVRCEFPLDLRGTRGLERLNLGFELLCKG